jgi:hypothetical protein
MMKMKEPIEWFSEAVTSNRYQKDIIEVMKECISEHGFKIDDFVRWVSKKIEEEMGGN